MQSLFWLSAQLSIHKSVHLSNYLAIYNYAEPVLLGHDWSIIYLSIYISIYKSICSDTNDPLSIQVSTILQSLFCWDTIDLLFIYPSTYLPINPSAGTQMIHYLSRYLQSCRVCSAGTRMIRDSARSGSKTTSSTGIDNEGPCDLSINLSICGRTICLLYLSIYSSIYLSNLFFYLATAQSL